MASRMERYYKADSPKKRSQLNQSLYRDIYEDGEYSNIEGVAMIDKNNEIDITKVKKMLKNREDYKRQKEYRNLVSKKEEVKDNISTDFISDDNKKSYDIMDVLKEAKEKNDDFDDRYLSLDNTNYKILKELKIEKESKKDEKTDGEELKDLINTITNTSMLNKLGDKELSLKLLEDLEGESNEKETKNNEEKEIDKSFYTASMKINPEDYEDDFIDKEDGKMIKIVVLIVLVILTLLLILFVVSKVLK